MSRSLSVRKPSTNELRRLHRWLEGPLQPWQRRRAEVLLLHAAGLPASAMAQLLQVHVNTVYADLRDFAQHGLSSLPAATGGGSAPPVPRANRHHLAPGEPTAHNPGPAVRPLDFGQASGLPHSTADCQSDQPGAPPSGAEKRGYALRRIQRKLFNTDPNRRLILHRLRRWWQHRPRGAILAFFDVKPSRSRPTAGDVTPRPGVWSCNGTKRPVAGSTCSCSTR